MNWTGLTADTSKDNPIDSIKSETLDFPVKKPKIGGTTNVAKKSKGVYGIWKTVVKIRSEEFLGSSMSRYIKVILLSMTDLKKWIIIGSDKMDTVDISSFLNEKNFSKGIFFPTLVKIHGVL